MQLNLIIFCCFQSLALQDGCQKKINLERVAPMLESTADSHVLAGSQFELTSVDGGCSLREHGLLCDEEIHARGSSIFTLEMACSSTGSLKIYFLYAHCLSCRLDNDTFYPPIVSCTLFHTWLPYICRFFLSQNTCI